MKSAQTLALMAAAEELARDLAALTLPAPTAMVADHTQHLQAVRDCTKRLRPIVAQHLEISGAANAAVEAAMQARAQARKVCEEAKVGFQAAQVALADAEAALATATQEDEQASAAQKAECEASGRLAVIKGAADRMAAAATTALQAATTERDKAASDKAEAKTQAGGGAVPASVPEAAPLPAQATSPPAASGSKRKAGELDRSGGPSSAGGILGRVATIREALVLKVEDYPSPMEALQAACSMLGLSSHGQNLMQLADAVESYL